MKEVRAKALKCWIDGALLLMCAGAAMAGEAADAGGLAEAVCFLQYFSDLPDPRQRGKVLYPPDEVLLLSLLAGAETLC